MAKEISDERTGTLYEAPELAASDPPRSFSAFALTPLPPVAQQGMKYLPWISFAVRCKACGGDDFRLGSRIEADPELSRQAPSNPTLLRPPHRLKCESCGAIETVFDPQTDGYDGVLTAALGVRRSKAKSALPRPFARSSWVRPTTSIWKN